MAKKRGGRRDNSGRKPKASWLAVFFACEEQRYKKLEKRAFDRHEQTSRAKKARDLQVSIGRTLARFRSPIGFKQPNPDKLAPKAVADLSKLGRLKSISIVNSKIDRKEILASVAEDFAISPATVDRFWKKGRRVQRDSAKD